MTNQWHALQDWDTLPGLFVDADDLNQQLRDNVEWLKERPFNTVNNTTRTTTSTTFVEMAGSSIALTSVGGNMLIAANGKCSNSTAANNNFFDLAIDGTRVGNSTNGLTIVTTHAANYNDCVDIVWFTSTPPSAASHNYSIFWKTSANTLSALMRLYVMEIR